MILEGDGLEVMAFSKPRASGDDPATQDADGYHLP